MGPKLKFNFKLKLLTNVSQNDPNNLDYFAFHNITGKANVLVG